MNAIQLRLSSKIDGTGRAEILFRISMREGMVVLTLRAKSGLYILPAHFQYYIDRKKCEKDNVRIPVKMITCTKDEANRRGYPILDKGEVVINGRIPTPDVLKDRETEERLHELTKTVLAAVNDHDTKILSSEALQILVDNFHHPEIHSRQVESIQKGEEIIESDDSKKNIFQLMELYLAKKQFSDFRVASYRVLIRTLWRYEAFKRASSNRAYIFDVDKVTRYDIEDFEDYLRNEYELEKKFPKIFRKIINNYPSYIVVGKKSPKLVQRGDNCIIGLKKRFKSFYNWLYETGRTKNRPFDGIKIGEEKYGRPIYISVQERNLIADFDLSERPALETQRDIFVFQCLVGCRVGDLMRLTKAHITNGILEYIPNKTKDEFIPTKARVPLNKRALALIEKYDGKDLQGRLFPFISPQKYNEAIKKVFTICGITRNVTYLNPKTGEVEVRPINEIAASHMARKTFIGAAHKAVKDPNIVGRMSGHVEGSKAFARYREIDDDMLKEVIDMID